MSLSGVDRSYWAIKNIYMPLPSSYAIGRQCWKAYLVFGSRCKYAAKIIHSFLSDSHSCLWKNCTKGSEKKEMFVRASAKAGGCVCAEGGWGGDSLRQCEKEILPDRHRVRYNTTEPCFQCQAFRVCRFLLAIIDGFYYAIHNPLHRLAGWLAGWRSCQRSQRLPPLFKPVTPCFQIFSDYANFHITMVPSRASEHTF